MEFALPVLTYHRVADQTSSAPEAVFCQHMRWLAEAGYQAISLAEFEGVMAGRFRPRPRSVLVSFDDGCDSDFMVAMPLLAELGFHAVSFLVTDRIGSGSCLTWAQARLMQASGVFSFQSHSHSHVLRQDLALSRQLISEFLSVPSSDLRHLAWPWGRCDAGFEAVALELGFDYQYLVQRGAVMGSGRHLRLPRWCCENTPLPVFARTLSWLSAPLSAKPINLLTGSVRLWRHGLGYF